MENIEIRRATFAERETVEAVARGCGKGVRSFFDVRNLEDEYKKGVIWLAEDGDRAVGFAYCCPLKRQPVSTLYELGVLPQDRGRGIASALVRASAEGRPVRLVVSVDNHDAVLYYLRRGLQLELPEPVPTRSGKSSVWRMSGVWRD